MIDRFKNGNPDNDHIIKRDKPTAKLRGFEGGDIRGVIQKLDEGYFDKLGITAIWMTPVVEQIHGSVDEGTGNTYGFHGYWTKDWTAIDPSFGTREDLKELVTKAHDTVNSELLIYPIELLIPSVCNSIISILFSFLFNYTIIISYFF